MKVTEIRYQRVKNLGNYETERCEVVGLVDDTESPDEIFSVLKVMAEEFLGLYEEPEDY